MRPVAGCEAASQSARGRPATPSPHQTGDTGPSKRGQLQSLQSGTAWLCGRPEDGIRRPRRSGDHLAALTRSFQPRPRCWTESGATLSCLPCWPSAAPRLRWQPALGHGNVHPPTAAADRVCVLDTRKAPDLGQFLSHDLNLFFSHHAPSMTCTSRLDYARHHRRA